MPKGDRSSMTYGYSVRPISAAENQFVIGIPPHMARLIRGKKFVPELTEEGLLYRLITLTEADNEPLPEWVKPVSARRSRARART